MLKTPGKIILKIWNKISQRFKNVRTDDLVIMPNHIHGILMITDNKRVTARVTPTLGDIIASFKSECVNEYLKFIRKKELDISGLLWQRNYYEHIIRNDKELEKYRNYIKDNSSRWSEDEYF